MAGEAQVVANRRSIWRLSTSREGRDCRASLAMTLCGTKPICAPVGRDRRADRAKQSQFRGARLPASRPIRLRTSSAGRACYGMFIAVGVQLNMCDQGHEPEWITPVGDKNQ